MTYVKLDKADGPKCPHCGCRDSEILKGSAAGSWFGGRQISRPMEIPPEFATQGTAVCGHCGRRFTVHRDVEPEAADALYADEEPVVDEPAEIAEDLDAAKKVPMPAKLQCPSCKSFDVIVRSTKRAKPPSTRTWRNHFCRQCNFTFQSYEETDSGG
jgi:hypothetical protein